MAKCPDPDSVKTRLSGYLPDSKRIELYRYLLDTTVGKLKEISGTETFISYTPENAGGYFLRYGAKTFPQSDGNIGERMLHAAKRIIGEGYEKVVIVGVDIPDISSHVVLKAFELLEKSDVVFGPATDGGYYLVGLNSPVEVIFKDIRWSTENVLEESIKLAETAGLSIDFTEVLSDIDTADDVRESGIMNDLGGGESQTSC